MSGNVQIDPLFVGLTRPTMLFGVSYLYAVLNLTVCTMLFLYTNSVILFLLVFPIHAVGYLGSLKEPRFVEIFLNKLQKCPRTKNGLFHSGNSYDPG